MDLDDDGIPDAGESGVSAIIVELYQDIDGDGEQYADDNLLDIDLTRPTSVLPLAIRPTTQALISLVKLM
ncbi:MAG: hypothetical protein GQ469_00475 [Methanosarcinales archaeon]|nr:hypothetical protein [Methanosarcinales archaeon]